MIIDSKKDELFFVNGSAGTGKDILYKTFIYYLMGTGFNVLPVAWTGIIAILLQGLPIDMHICDTCSLSRKWK